MEVKFREFEYTMEKATEDAKKYYNENGNKKIIIEEFPACNLKSLIAYVDEYNIKYSDVKLIPSSKEVNWGDGTEEFIDVNFVIQLKDEELEDAIKELAEKLYKESIEKYEKEIKTLFELTEWELFRKYKEKIK